MALKMDVTLDQIEVTIPSAYIRVEQILRNRFEQGMECLARCYKEDPGFPPARPAFKDITFSVEYNPDGGDAFAQAYSGAKQLPEFAGAVDA